MTIQKVEIPDIGDAEEVEVIELCVSAGDEVSLDDILIVVESDKASMEIPSPLAGKVVSIDVALGDSVSFGSVILSLETGSSESEVPENKPEPESEPESEPGPGKEKEPEKLAKKQVVESSTPSSTTITVPDIGDAQDVVVIEILVKKGDKVALDDLLIVVESDKASMEIPSPAEGVVEKILVEEGSEVNEGSALLELTLTGALASQVCATKANKSISDSKAPSAAAAKPDKPESDKSRSATAKSATAESATAKGNTATANSRVYAGPAVRKLARELGVTLNKVSGTGVGGRIVKEDVQAFVKSALQVSSSANESAAAIPVVPAIDFSKFGKTELLPMSRIRKRGAANLHRSWLNVPHVTQNDEADISELEDFRKSLAGEAKKKGVRLTPLAFLIKASYLALKQFPVVNSSLDPAIENFIIKYYYNIGVAVDTPNGLVVPVVKEVDSKGIWDIAEELMSLSEKARLGKLSAAEMQGASFTISSLGPIGGTSFTPIVNTPEVAILGVSRMAIKPQWDGDKFVPRKMLPLSFSYDHRAINGAEAGRFTTYLCGVLKDFRQGLM